MAPKELWSSIGFSHLLKSAQGSDETLLVAEAKPPVVHRYRFPQCVLAIICVIHVLTIAFFSRLSRRFEQYSPHSHPVGVKLSADDVVVKRD